MRILLISWEYPPYIVGGLGKHVAELVSAYRYLFNDDYEHSDGYALGNDLGSPIAIDILCTRNAGGPTKEIVNPNITIYRVDSPPSVTTDQYKDVLATNSSLVNRARILHRQQKYDLVHSHDWLTGSAGITLKNEWKVPLLATIHATERGRHQGNLPNEMSHRINGLEGQICYEAWRVIVCSGHMQKELQEFFSVPQDKINVIPNGIDFRALHRCNPSTIEAYRKRYSNDGENLLFFVGRITYEKGLQVLIKAMPFILEHSPKTRLLVAGKNSEQLWAMVQEMRLGHAVTLLGYISDQQRDYFYQSVDAAIFPSLYEPFGIVALEAMALGCNVIASDTGGLGEVVQHLQNGLTIHPDDPASIAWAVNRLFSEPEEATIQRKFAVQQIKDLYDWRDIAKNTLDLYAQIVRERQSVKW